MMKDLKINKTPIEDFLTKNILTSKRNVNDKNKENSKDKDNSFPHLPLQVHLMIKHKNMGKIDSHRWFFKGVGNMISPEFVQLIDGGSIPLQNSITHIIEYMNENEELGGAGGEIEGITSDEYGDYMGGLSKPKSWIKRQTDNMVILTQYSEYKIAHYLDKAAESLFGFVSVLPGAFSTFRWEAVNGSPLDEFLKGSSNDIDEEYKVMPGKDKNKYLAEDRIMCLEIVAKVDDSDSNRNYYLEYIPGSKCLTDPPESLNDLIIQRRRWYNGSLFASIHVLINMMKIWKRKLWLKNLGLSIFYLFLVFQNIISFCSIGGFYAAYSIFLREAFPSTRGSNSFEVANILENLYILSLLLLLFLGTSADAKDLNIEFWIFTIIFSIFTLLMICGSIYYAFGGSISLITILLFGLYVLTYAIPIILNGGRFRISTLIGGLIGG